MKNRFITLLAVLNAFTGLPADAGDVQVKIVVKDDAGQLVDGADVGVCFEVLGPNDQSVEKQAKTDERGVVEFSGGDNGGCELMSFVVYVTKDGYYKTLARKTDVENPKHELNLTLKRILNPVQLCSKRFPIISPAFGKQVGYDFEVGDWVAPYGKGVTVDILFMTHYEERSDDDYDFRNEVSFSNKQDGIQEFKAHEFSDLRSDYNSPEQGYVSSWVQTIERRPGLETKGNRSPDRNFWLRVRTKVVDGKIVSANYVKIYGDFPDITYYYNPKPNDRNLEFNPSRNLFPYKNSEIPVFDP